MTRLQRHLHRPSVMVMLVGTICAWSVAAGMVLVLNDAVLDTERAWLPSRFNGHVPLSVYGFVLLFCGMAVAFTWNHTLMRRWATACSLFGGGVSAFLAITQLIEALQSGVGLIGVVCFSLAAAVYGIVYLELHGAPLGGDE